MQPKLANLLWGFAQEQQALDVSVHIPPFLQFILSDNCQKFACKGILPLTSFETIIARYGITKLGKELLWQIVTASIKSRFI